MEPTPRFFSGLGMSEIIKAQQHGERIELSIPRSVAEAASIRDGDEVVVTATEDGILVTLVDPEEADVLRDLDAFMTTHEEAFRRLAR